MLGSVMALTSARRRPQLPISMGLHDAILRPLAIRRDSRRLRAADIFIFRATPLAGVAQFPGLHFSRCLAALSQIKAFDFARFSAEERNR